MATFFFLVFFSRLFFGEYAVRAVVGVVVDLVVVVFSAATTAAAVADAAILYFLCVSIVASNWILRVVKQRG